MSSQRISVAMATCEGARFVDEQLDSIASQTRPPDELVVCDDASADDTYERVETFAARAPFEVRATRNPSRLGITRNFEQAMSRCSGDVVFLADQDDVWQPQKIESLTEVLIAQPSIGAVFCDGDVTDAAGLPLGYSLWRSLGFDEGEQRAVREGRAIDVFLRHVVAAGTTLAFRASLLERALPLPALHSCHDAFVAFVAAATSGVAIVPQRLIRYRLHGDNQIGIQKLGWLGQLAKAREQLDSEAFDYAVAFFETARERLPDASAETRGAIDAKILHSRRRAAMAPSLRERLGGIGGELASGRYQRFSYGWKSVVQDLFLR